MLLLCHFFLCRLYWVELSLGEELLYEHPQMVEEGRSLTVASLHAKVSSCFAQCFLLEVNGAAEVDRYNNELDKKILCKRSNTQSPITLTHNPYLSKGGIFS